jgi:transcriptional regulator with XRE-family HTH domain
MNHIIKELYSGNKRAFANAIGVSATVIENVVGTRQGKPSYDVLEKICANANISAEWLLMERGEMLYNPTTQSQYTPPDQNTHYFIEKIAEQAEEIGKLKEQVKLLGTQKSAAPDAICADVV